MFVKGKLALVLALCMCEAVFAKKSIAPREILLHTKVDLQRSDGQVNLRETRHLGTEVIPENYIVRVQRYGTPTIFQDLKKLAAGGFVRYVPHDSYLIALFGGQINTVLSIPGVEGVYDVPSESKIGPRRPESNHTHGRPESAWNPSSHANPARGGGPRFVTELPPNHGNHGHGNRRTETRVTIDCLVAITEITAPGFETVLPEWIIALQHETVGGANTQVDWPSWEKLVVDTDASSEEAVMAWLSNRPLVFWMEKRPMFDFKNGYATKAIQSTDGLSNSIWEKGLTGENEIIGCADTGLDHDGCHFNDAGQSVAVCEGLGFVPGCTNMNHRKVVSYRYFAGRSDAKDVRWGHGTHVAGSIAGNAGWPQPGQVNYNGAAPDAKIAFDDISPDGAYLWPTNDLNTQLLPHSYAIGARLHSNSWGSDTSEYTSTSKEIDQFIYEHDDFLVLVAAGNDGENGLGTVGSPATAKNILAVGAGQNTKESYGSDSADMGMDNLVDFSSRGPTSDGRFKPDVVCPGDSIFSAWSDGEENSVDQCYIGGMSGTSMATPLCAGSAALVRQYFKEGFYANGDKDLSQAFEPSAALVKAMMIHSGQKMWYRTVNGDWRWPDALPIIELGYGRVDLSKVLWFGAESDFQLRVLDRERINPGPEQVREFEFVVADSSPELKVTLVWTDPPGMPDATISLIHNLDLTITHPSGATWTGNGFVDDRNNNEQVTIVNPLSGRYTVKVAAFELPQGAQDFTLVVTGALSSAEEPPAPTNPPTTAPETTAAPTTAAPTSSSTTAAPTTSSSTAEAPTTSSSTTEAPTTTSSAADPTTSSPATTEAAAPTSSTPTPTSTAAEETTAEATTSEPEAPTTSAELPTTSAAETTSAPTSTAGEEPGTTTAEETTAAPETPTTTPAQTPECSESWTEIEDSPFSGSQTPFSVSLPPGTTRVEFTSDAANTRPGFLAMYGPDSEPVESSCATTGTLREVFGAISDGAGDYGNDEYCRWVIAPEGTTAVTLVFESFDLENWYDFLYVYKCKTEACLQSDRVSLGDFTGSELPDMIQSDAEYPYMLLEFESDYSITRAGFRAVYAASAVSECASDGALLSAAAGFIRESAGTYSNSQQCTWNIEVGSSGLRLTFLDFDTESNKDFVSVKTSQSLCEDNAPTTTAVDPRETTAGDPPETTSAQDPPEPTTPALPAPSTTPAPVDDECTDFAAISGSPFSGRSRPQIVTATSIRVDFASDWSEVRPGFSAMYRPVGAQAPSFTCGQTGRLTGGWGEISDGPANYENDQECEWIIGSSGGSGVTLNFETFALETGWDNLYIDTCDDEACSSPQPVDGSPFTGSAVPSFRFFETDFLRIKLVTDESIVDAGFKLSYTAGPITDCEPNAVLSAEAGFIRERAGDYSNGMQCSWEIRGPSGLQTQLTFLEFWTERGWDLVDIEACASGARRSSAGVSRDEAARAREDKVRQDRLQHPKPTTSGKQGQSPSKPKKLQVRPAVSSAGADKVVDAEKEQRAARVRKNALQMSAGLR